MCVCAPICIRTYVVTCAMYIGPVCVCMCTYVQIYVLCIYDPYMYAYVFIMHTCV
jgi:hypothetical protein